MRSLFALDRALVVAAVSISVALACGPPRLPAPDYTGQPTSALSEVPYPPPPARVEVVPKQPADDAVWVDGEWLWQARRYAWKPGRWVVPPPGARFAPWTTVRDARGTLFLAKGSWRDAKGGQLAEPPPLAAGVPGIAPIVSPEGRTIPVGPILPADAGNPEDEDAGPASDLARRSEERMAHVTRAREGRADRPSWYTSRRHDG